MDIRPGEAVAQAPRTRPPLAIHRSSNRDDHQARRMRSANHIRAKPAHPTVISNIIDSFEALIPPPLVHAEESLSESASRGSFSSDAASASAPSIARSATSPAFGMEFGRAASITEEDGHPDAAPPPSIRTSRRPSGLTQHAPPSVERMNSDLSGYLRPASISSRNSSYSSLSRDRERGERSKHSAESWIKRESISGSALSGDKDKERRKSVRRVHSQKTLRQPVVEDIPLPTRTAEQLALTRAERIIARTPPPLVDTKSRLYLTDSNQSEERVVRDSLLSETKSSEVEESPKSSQKGPASIKTISTDQTTPSPKRVSPLTNPIINSVPTRTSSLRATSASPAPSRKKDKKSKRTTVAVSTPESPVESKSTIPESSWADLGEDDETVKRIRELRERRKSRIEESRASSLLADIPQLPKESPARDPSPAHQPPARRSEESQRAARARPIAFGRAATEPPSKAHKILGITDRSVNMPPLTSSYSEYARMRPGTASPDVRRGPPVKLQERAAVQYLQQQRPATASSPTPPLSLDYSYAQAVDALQGAERERSPEQRPTHPRKPSKSSIILGTVSLPPLAQPPETPLSRNGSARSRPKSQNARHRPDPSARWTHHPDLPLDIAEKRKSRRKSMSDARRTRHFDDEQLQLALERRDSIEDAVGEYLQAPRLSRKIRHPRSGRVISFSEVGDPDGAAVFICVGMGLTRYVTAFYDELATTLRLRLITVDRPGVGGSAPYPVNDRSGPLSWPDDVLAICQHLGIASFSLLAHSAGAIYALATALTLPHLIKGKVHLLAPWIPPSQLEAISHPTASAPPAGALPRSQRLLRVLPTSFLKAANSSFMTATSASLKPASKRQIQAARDRSREQSLSPTNRSNERPGTAGGQRPDYHRRESMMLMDQFMPTTNPMESFILSVEEEDEDTATPNPRTTDADRRTSLFLGATATPTDPTFTFAQTALSAAEHAERERQLEYTSRLTARTWERATRDSNPATDLLVCLERNRDVGFKYTDVQRHAVVITHGAEDRRVPVGNVRWLAGQMNARVLAAEEGSLHRSRDGGAPPRSRGGCEVRVLEGEGHGLMASAVIMGDVLTEIAGYWASEKRGLGV
ncbi:hypothetical protein LTR53_003084 [Teratosphaeriaceae sp. CCFEE 6253]|nr:hypothetical protein LTR53_003084 [Teratosphaeriaceae sp. CCFEE 6253]